LAAGDRGGPETLRGFAPKLTFQVIAECHDYAGQPLITTNCSFKDWTNGWSLS
jgi:hypothetical protein